MLANVYLTDFDVEINSYAKARGGRYFRYSDDILVIIPGDCQVGFDAEAHVRGRISAHGRKLRIKQDKSSIVSYSLLESGGQCFQHCFGSQGKNGVEYLGFRFDGSATYVRNSTVSNLLRKTVYRARREAYRYVDENRDKSLPELLDSFDYDRFIAQFRLVENFEEQSGVYRNWTFWTYLKRAANRFPESAQRLFKQFRRYKGFARRKMRGELIKAYAKAGKAEGASE